jgi:hypothetical protein
MDEGVLVDPVEFVGFNFYDLESPYFIVYSSYG